MPENARGQEKNAAHQSQCCTDANAEQAERQGDQPDDRGEQEDEQCQRPAQCQQNAPGDEQNERVWFAEVWSATAAWALRPSTERLAQCGPRQDSRGTQGWRRRVGITNKERELCTPERHRVASAALAVSDYLARRAIASEIPPREGR